MPWCICARPAAPCALHGQRPAPPAGAIPHLERKPLGGRQGQEGVGLRLHRRGVPAAVMQEGRLDAGPAPDYRDGPAPGPAPGLLTPPHGLRRIAQAPQRVGRIGQAPHPRRHAMAERQGALRRRVGEGDPLLEVRPGRRRSRPGRTRSTRGRHAPPGSGLGSAARWASRQSCSPSSRAVGNAPRLR